MKTSFTTCLPVCWLATFVLAEVDTEALTDGAVIFVVRRNGACYGELPSIQQPKQTPKRSQSHGD